MRKGWLLAAALSVALAGDTSAQAAPRTELKLQRVRLDTLTAQWRRAKARLDAFDDSIARSRTLLDTIVVGHLRVLVSKSMRERIQPAVAATWVHLDSIFGNAAVMLDRHQFVVRQLLDMPDTISIGAVMRPGFRFPKGREIEKLWGRFSDTLVLRGLTIGATHLLSAEMDSSFSRWLYSDLNPDTVSTFHWTQTRLELLSSSATVAQRCYNGDIKACRITLRLEPVADRATEWFDADGRRKFFQQTFPWRYRSPLEDSCREGNDAACIAAIRQMRLFTPFPATAVLVSSVTQTALRLGGRNSLERLIKSKAPPERALAEAAGVPLDSVLKVWQRNARDARMPSQDVSLGIAATSLMWIAVCGALSLRSSRWR